MTPSKNHPLKIGTRGSPLALVQAHQVRAELMDALGLDLDCFEIVVIKTEGDKIQDRALGLVGGKGLFTDAIEERLLSKELDIAVHSTKDMPTKLPDGLVLSTILPREDPRDAFISLKYANLEAVPHGATIGTASLRRQAQMRRIRPDLNIVNFRGNVDTRLKKIEAGVVDGTLLAVAGLNRLGLHRHISQYLDTDQFLPAIAQGAVCIEQIETRKELIDFLKPLNCFETQLCVSAERTFLSELDGSCKTPIAGHAFIEGPTMTLVGQVLSHDGVTSFEVSEIAAIATITQAQSLGHAAGVKLREKAGSEFLEAILLPGQILETR